MSYSKTYGFVKKDLKTGKDSIFLNFKSKNTNFEVRISPYFGSNIYSFKYNGNELLHCNYELLKSRGWTGCFILWPIPNRVRRKIFEFEGKIYSLDKIKRKSGNYHLIHGLVDDKQFSFGKITVKNNSVSVSTSIEINEESEVYKYFPFKSKLKLFFILYSQGLKIKYEVVNLSEKNLPFGFALHPYFSIQSKLKDAELFLPAKHVMETDQDLLPTGKLINLTDTKFNLNTPMKLDNLSLDHVFTNLSKNKIPYINFGRQKYKISFLCSKDFTHVVLYTPNKPYFCFENQTGSTDMINLYTKGVKYKMTKMQKAAHLIVLSPNMKHSGFIKYQIEMSK
jgi:aldose 1-epimerase